MKNIAYLRVSKDSQDVKNQRLSILDLNSCFSKWSRTY